MPRFAEAPVSANWIVSRSSCEVRGARPFAFGLGEELVWSRRDGTGMNWDEDIASRLMAAIAALPPEEQTDAVHAVLSGVLKQMPLDGLFDVREEIAGMYEDEPLDIVRTTLDMIDGQIALREIAGTDEWR